MIKHCNKCKKRIANKSIIVSGVTFHPECFVCKECKKKIKGSYNSKDNIFYHNDCFQKKFRLFCGKCKKPLTGKYISSMGRKYHENCYESAKLKCSICNEVIEGKYTYDSSGKYHEECYKQEKVPKCDICLIPFESQYILDNWGNKSHPEHDGVKPDFCGTCSRIISESITKGSANYKDGRKICGICQETEIISEDQTIPSKLKVTESLKKVGFDYIPNFIKITLVDKVTMNKMIGASITSNTHGYTKTVSKIVNRKIVSQEHSICMLYGLPKLVFEGVLAHELLHVWLNEKQSKLRHRETEGFCNLGAYLIYKNDCSKDSEIQIKNLEQDSDHVYGDGYRIMKKMLEEKGWGAVINHAISYQPKTIKKVIE